MWKRTFVGYLAGKGAAELWGLDLSPVQIAIARQVMAERGYRANLVESPMDEDPGFPREYFDIVFSIYALGWTPDLDMTMALVSKWLKPGGVFVFSWEHPAFSCMEYQDGAGRLERPYATEGPRVVQWRGETFVMFHRKLGTFVNSLCAAGLNIQRIVEESCIDEVRDSRRASQWYTVHRARLVPTTVIISAKKGG